MPPADAVRIAPPGWPALPERTIVAEVARWCATWLTQPDGPDAGEPWSFTDEQLRLMAYWFAYDERARWLYRRGTLRMCKGWGKDPIAAVLAMLELCGPSRIEHGTFNAARNPAAWVQIAAVSQAQTRTTMLLFEPLVPERTRRKFGLEVNKEVIYANGGGKIEAVTSRPKSLEGGRVSLVIRNETQNWDSSNAGHDMAEVIDGNLAKSRDGAARALSLCNAHVPGRDTVGEREWDAYQAILAGRTRVSDVLYYAVEAPPTTRMDDGDSLRQGIIGARSDAVWLDPDRLIAEIWDPRTTPSEARRKYLNQVVAAEDAWLAPIEWDAGKRTDEPLEDETLVTLGFDGSKTDDHSALEAVRVSDGRIFTLGVWVPPLDGEIDRDKIDAAVSKAFERFDVVGFYSDLHPWESYVDRWRDDFGADLCARATTHHPIAWDMRSRDRDFTRAAERFHDAVTEGKLTHDGDPRLREHVLNARRRPNRHGLSFGKEHRESARKVDAAAAAVLARLAWLDYLALPETKQRRPKRSGRAAFY